MSFQLPKLPYAYDALEPHIDARTMEIHHSKHHNGYTTNLNNAIAGTDLEGKSILDILTNLDMSNMAAKSSISVKPPILLLVFNDDTNGSNNRIFLFDRCHGQDRAVNSSQKVFQQGSHHLLS